MYLKRVDVLIGGGGGYCVFFGGWWGVLAHYDGNGK